MTALSIIIDIVLILISIVLIVVVLMQQGQRQGAQAHVPPAGRQRPVIVDKAPGGVIK